jgi:hypothetical protein
VSIVGSLITISTSPWALDVDRDLKCEQMSSRKPQAQESRSFLRLTRGSHKRKENCCMLSSNSIIAQTLTYLSRHSHRSFTYLVTLEDFWRETPYFSSLEISFKGVTRCSRLILIKIMNLVYFRDWRRQQVI